MWCQECEETEMDTEEYEGWHICTECQKSCVMIVPRLTAMSVWKTIPTTASSSCSCIKREKETADRQLTHELANQEAGVKPVLQNSKSRLDNSEANTR